MASPEHSDPYLDPTTGVLRNKVGALTRADLASGEGALAFARAVELADTPVPATGDLNEFRAIHRHLFQDVYDWAGLRELLRQMHHSPVPRDRSEVRIDEMTHV
ncbi:MAG: hypothetical protein ACK5LO_10040 [Leucobacter sp.]